MKLGISVDAQLLEMTVRRLRVIGFVSRRRMFRHQVAVRRSNDFVVHWVSLHCEA